MRPARERARIERVRILLQTRNDCYPSPRSLSIPSTPSGPAPGRKRKCPACGGDGKARRWQKCGVCDGVGTVELDSYVGRVSGSGERRPEGMTPQQLDAELARLELQLDRTGMVRPDEKYGWEKAREQQDKQGSYPELNQALLKLSVQARSFLLWVYDSGLNPELGPDATRYEEELVAQLADLMPSKIRLPKHLAREYAARKEALVLELHRCTVDIEEIADKAAVSVATVRRILSNDRPVTKAHSAATILA